VAASQINFSTGTANNMTAFATLWYTRLGVFSCPPDGDQDGFRNFGSGKRDGQDISTAPPRPPGGGATKVPVSDYLGSFGDNYCIGCNSGMQFPTETPISVWPPIPGQTLSRLRHRHLQRLAAREG